MVTNGFIEEEPLLNLLNYLDALNIDLKLIVMIFIKDLEVLQ